MIGRRIALAASAALIPLAARADSMTYLVGHGTKAYPVVWLTWGTIVVSVVVTLVVGALLLAGIFRRRPPLTVEDPQRAPIVSSAGGDSWITIGVGVSALVLFATAIWSFVVLAAVSRPALPEKPVSIEITGHQWWWEAKYTSPDQSRIFTTANEIHVPTGQPVFLKLIGADVIHSFWVPALTGKTDVIPGQQNTMWLEASKPGVYRGQCTEYCGKQHAHMALFVIADPPHAFQAWWDHELQGAVPPRSQDTADGEALFVARCGGCHSMRGTNAGGIVGPDLSHLMSRSTIAAGTLPNTPGHLSAWIADPQRVKPGNRMPVLELPGPELAKIRQFLELQQ